MSDCYFDESDQTYNISGLSKRQGGDLKIRRFDMNKVQKDAHCIIIAPSNSGKHSILSDYMYTKREGKIFGFCGSENVKNQYANKLIPGVFVQSEDYVDEKKLEGMLRGPRDKFSTMTNQEKDNFHKSLTLADYTNIVIDDHYATMDKWVKYVPIKQIMSLGRHYPVLLTILTQEMTDSIPGYMKTNMHYVMIGGISGKNNKKIVFEKYTDFETQTDFEKVVKHVVKNYTFLIFDRTVSSSNIEDKVFWYKSDMSKTGTYRAGTDSQWQFSKKHYREVAVERKPLDQVNENIIYIDVDKTDPIVLNPIIRKYNNLY